MQLGSRGASISFLCLALGCVAEEPIGESTGAVVNGIPVDDMDATVRLTNVWGGLCSGSLVAPQVVMTAKHCLDGGTFGWLIGIGPTGADRSVDIDDVLLTEDLGGDVYQNEDIAFAILESPVEDVVPYPMPWAGDDLHGGDDVTLLGYGGTEDGTAGRKFKTTDRVLGVGDFEFVTSGNGVCGGDSGGTALDENGVVVGVIVRGPVGDCEEIPGGRGTALTRVSTWLDLAREAFDQTGACYPTGEEVCDGRDNDCNGTVDDGCDPIGAPCTIADDCSSETCEVVEGERICTDRCDPRLPGSGCGEGFCRETSCGEGWCVAGTAGEGVPGDACDSETDCASLVCTGGVCAERCTFGAGACAPGEVCWSDGGCSAGGCIDESLAPDAPRGLGETCAHDGDCASGDCRATDLGRYCTARCEGDPSVCPDGYHCEDGACRRGPLGETGDPCATDAECASGTCAHWEAGNACTEICDDGDCPTGLSCVAAAGFRLCEPDAAPTGQGCRENHDCLRGLCGEFATGKLCTELCDESEPCPSGFDCVATTSDARVCAKPGSLAAGGGCRAAGPSSAGLAWLLVIPLALTRARARRRHPT